MHLGRFLISLLMFSLALPVVAKEKLIFASFPIPLMVEDKDNGVFVELTQALIKRAGLNAEIQVNPPKRSISHLINGKADVLFPALDAFFPDLSMIADSSESILYKRGLCFYAKRHRAADFYK